MMEPAWDEIDLVGARECARTAADGAPPDGRVIALRHHGRASVVLVRADPHGDWALVYVCTDRAGVRVEDSSALLDLTAEHTFQVGSAAARYGQPPRLHFAAIRSPGVTTARTRWPGKPWRILTADPDRWILDVLATDDFEAPAYEFEAPDGTWHRIG
ncbi:hypothetical protein DNL40_12215 [Xylanimonas oleitrophica]|uniref:Uncharacterized protein n=1 Tax=Xylanimonas oleitrophica TaxID=2607479 RepID=A0A2W5WVW3_9MICO|nr:hypothetical protein [Xylanimonas oleitrophica]PZR52426.1 hypothetical protein DNL40_12215 [Xylanimonas oleitrophica]